MDGVFAYQYTPAARLRVSGEDAADFLQSQFSNDLRPFTEGQAVYGLWLDVKGKVVADSTVLCAGDEEFRVISEHCPAESIAEKLERHIIADDVEIEALDTGVAISLVGQQAGAVLAALELAVPEARQFTANADGVCFVGRRALEPSYEVLFNQQAAADAAIDTLKSLGVNVVSNEWIQKQRMHASIPLVPQELGASDLPGEGGFVGDAVSLDKGCYLGQEVVARMHNVGQARRGLYLMEGEGVVPEIPAEIRNPEERPAGQLRSVIARESGWLGVAMLKIRSADEALTLESEEPVQVVRPFRIESHG